MMRPFHLAADWPGALPADLEHLDMQAVKLAAYRRVENDLCVATRLYPVREWLDAAPGGGLLRDLLSCMLAADCWKARLACPQEGFPGLPWERYFAARVDAARPFLSAALARWVVLERIPMRWIPEDQVRAHVALRMKECALEVEVTGLHLIPPVPGGSEWVRRDCGRGIESVVSCAQKAPVAAILHWPNRTAAAIVTSIAGSMRAFGAAFEADGLAFDVVELVGGEVVPALEPPMSTLQRCARIFGLGGWIWRWNRSRRIRKGASSLAAI